NGWTKSELLSHPQVVPFCRLFEQIGISPSRQPPSFAGFLWRALTRPDVPTIHPIVDWVNHAAVETMSSLGVFDATAVRGRMRLDASVAGDAFEPLGGDGIESIPPGRLVLRDDERVLSLFAIRDGVDQAIRASTQSVIVLSCIAAGVDASHARDGLVQACRRLAALGLHDAPEDGPDPAPGNARAAADDRPGWFGPYGGCFIPETLVPAVRALDEARRRIVPTPAFQDRLSHLLRTWVGRETPLTLAENFSRAIGVKTYLKREDLAHTGAHKINNALGQALLASMMGKRRVVAETGAGQHGVATAAACALLRLDCTIYMGERDMERQALNVLRMRLMGAQVIGVSIGSRTLKDAINDALRDWVTHVEDSYYLLGSALGPHPYPTLVRDFQSVIGREVREQFQQAEGGALPDAMVACVGGGSNAIGLFHPFLGDRDVRMFGIEAGGQGPASGQHSIRVAPGGDSRVGVLQGTRSYLMQDADGQVLETHSIAPGLDYAMLGPEHARLRDEGRVSYLHATDDEALRALELLSRTEGIIPALESAHALAGAAKVAASLPRGSRMVINLSGRGDKDLSAIADLVTMSPDARSHA
ncbi:MAG TPA: tryptophan synthase subunit beta, partial [Burkholderiaceae bacterium]|nr:tryptophan synthase subunit beta [Burkholderiaceae bacterium]